MMLRAVPDVCLSIWLFQMPAGLSRSRKMESPVCHQSQVDDKAHTCRRHSGLRVPVAAYGGHASPLPDQGATTALPIEVAGPAPGRERRGAEFDFRAYFHGRILGSRVRAFRSPFPKSLLHDGEPWALRGREATA